MLRFSRIRKIIRISNLSNWVISLLTLANFLLFYGILSRPKIETKFKNEIFIEQGIGNIYFYQYINFRNSGRKAGHIINIEGFIRSKDRDVLQFRKKITAQSFSYNGNSPFTEITLAQDQSFSAEFRLYKEPDRITRDSIALIYSLGLNEYDSASMRKNSQNLLLLFNVSKKLSNLIDNFNEQRVSELRTGEYEYIIEVTSDNSEHFEKCYSFFIYPDNITQFKEIRKDYKKYSKFVYEGRRSNVSIPLTEIENKQIIESLRKELHGFVN